jgi:hypothetical protein
MQEPFSGSCFFSRHQTILIWFSEWIFLNNQRRYFGINSTAGRFLKRRKTGIILEQHIAENSDSF